MAEPVYPTLPEPTYKRGAKLNQFITEIKTSGLARTNRFAVDIALPRILQGGANPYVNLQQAMLLVENVQLPSINLNTIQNRTYGEYRETPYESVYDNINVSFYVDKQMKVKSLFESWILGIQGYDASNPASGQGTRNFKYYDDYTTDLTIWVYDTLDKRVYGVALYEAYPKTIGSITLDNNSKDIMKLNVTFQYKFWRPGVVEGGRREWLGTAPDPSIFDSMNQDLGRYTPF